MYTATRDSANVSRTHFSGNGPEPIRARGFRAIFIPAAIAAEAAVSVVVRLL